MCLFTVPGVLLMSHTQTHGWIAHVSYPDWSGYEAGWITHAASVSFPVLLSGFSSKALMEMCCIQVSERE